MTTGYLDKTITDGGVYSAMTDGYNISSVKVIGVALTLLTV